MSATREVARNEIFAALKAAWDAGAGVTAGKVILWPNTPGSPPLQQEGDTSSPPFWARVKLDFTERGQGSLSGANGQTMYSQTGFLFVQLFEPSGKGLLITDKASKILFDAFDELKTASGVWFRRARSVEVGNEGNWFQTNFIVEFNYDEIK